MRSNQPVSIRRKWSAVLTVFFLFSRSFSASAIVLEDINYTAEMVELDKNYNEILDFTDSKRCISYKDDLKLECDVYEDTITYLYKTQVDAPLNVINKNTIQLDPTTYQIYAADEFYQDEQTNTWKQTEFGVINKEDFQIYQADQLKNIEEVSRFNNPFKIYKVNAQSFYSGSGDGEIYKQCDGWANCKSSSSGTATNGGTSALNGWYEAGTTDELHRVFIPFDTSVLEDNICIASSSIYLYQTSSYAGTPEMCIVPASQASNSTLVNDDYDNWTATKASDCPTIQQTKYNKFLLNYTGTTTISTTGYTLFGLLLEQDIDNSLLSDSQYARVNLSEAAGTVNDPFILITTIECPSEEEEPAATTTLSSLPPLPLIDDLTVITGRTDHYESSTTAADWSELHYYRVPAILWWIVASTFIFVLSFMLNQIQRILRKKK